MEINIKKQKPNREYNLLELIPNRNYKHKYREENLIDVLVPRFNDKFFGKWLQPRLKNPYIRANLDIFGSNIWELINDEYSVAQIIDIMEEKFTGEKDLKDRIIIFIQNLYRNGFIKFINIKKEIYNV